MYMFFNFGCSLYGSFFVFFQKLRLCVKKRFLKQFLLHCTSICVSSKSVSQNFRILFQTGNIGIFVLRGVFFSRYVQLRSCFFSVWVFFHVHLRITGLQGKGESISLTPHYHFRPLRGRLGISRAIAAGSSPLHITSSRTRTGKLWFPSASR